MSYDKDRISQHPLHLLPLTFFLSLTWDGLWTLGWGGLDIYFCLSTQQTFIFSTLTSCKSLALAAGHCREKYLWPRLRSGLLCEGKHKYLEGSLATCGLAKQSTFLSYELWPSLQYQAWVPSCGTGFKSNTEVVGHPHNLCATIAPVFVSMSYKCFIRQYIPVIFLCFTDGFSFSVLWLSSIHYVMDQDSYFWHLFRLSLISTNINLIAL